MESSFRRGWGEKALYGKMRDGGEEGREGGHWSATHMLEE